MNVKDLNRLVRNPVEQWGDKDEFLDKILSNKIDDIFMYEDSRHLCTVVGSDNLLEFRQHLKSYIMFRKSKDALIDFINSVIFKLHTITKKSENENEIVPGSPNTEKSNVSVTKSDQKLNK